MDPSDEARQALIDALKAAFTEERTDALLDALVSRLPVWIRWLPIRGVLDRVLPEALIEAVEEVL